MWWLIVFASLSTGLGHGVMTLFRVCWWGCFWVRLTFESVHWIKQFPVLRAGSSNQWKAWIERKGWRNSSCLIVKLGHGLLLSDSDWSTNSSSGLLTFALEFYYWLSWLSDFWIWTEATPLSLLSLQLAKCSSCNSLASIIEPVSCTWSKL